SIFFTAILRRAPSSTLFPYTTLFRSIFEFPSHTSCYRSSFSVLPFLPTLIRPGSFGFSLLFISYCIPPATDTIVTLIKTKKASRSEEHTSELQSRENLVCRLLLEKKK